MKSRRSTAPDAKSKQVSLHRDDRGWVLDGPEGSMFLPADQARLLAEKILTAENGSANVGCGESAKSRAPETLTEKVVRLIRADLDQGVFGAGQRLDETRLAARYGVSRTPVRDALTQLAASGLIVRIPRQGCRVAGGA